MALFRLIAFVLFVASIHPAQAVGLHACMQTFATFDPAKDAVLPFTGQRVPCSTLEAIRTDAVLTEDEIANVDDVTAAIRQMRAMRAEADDYLRSELVELVGTARETLRKSIEGALASTKAIGAATPTVRGGGSGWKALLRYTLKAQQKVGEAIDAYFEMKDAELLAESSVTLMNYLSDRIGTLEAGSRESQDRLGTFLMLCEVVAEQCTTTPHPAFLP